MAEFVKDVQVAADFFEGLADRLRGGRQTGLDNDAWRAGQRAADSYVKDILTDEGQGLTLGMVIEEELSDMDVKVEADI